MLAAMMVLRPNLSISQPPSRPNTPPHTAAMVSRLPTQLVTIGLLGGSFSNSAMAGAATSGVMSSSYVSNRKPMLAMTMMSQCLVVSVGAGEDMVRDAVRSWDASQRPRREESITR